MTVPSRSRAAALAAAFAALSAACAPDQRAAVPAGRAPAASGHGSGVAARAPDAFYDPPPDAPSRPGVLLRTDPLTGVRLPEGMRAWRIFYTTTIDDRTPATAAAVVYVPADAPAGPRPVISWTHGTTGLEQKCMPSVLSEPAIYLPARDRIAEEGWVVVATDYSFTEKGGPHPYLIGEGEARAALDAVRAARQIPESQIGVSLDRRVVAWGHSQGGHAALWSGIVAPRYAPNLDLVGVVGVAPAAGVANIASSEGVAAKMYAPYLAGAYARFYPDVTLEAAVRPEALDAAREIMPLCGVVPSDSERMKALAQSFDGPALNKDDPALAARLRENAASRRIAAPVAIAQGLADAVVPPPSTAAFVEQRCAAGQPIDLWTFDGQDHGSIVDRGSPLEEPLLAWTRARFAGEPAAEQCGTQAF